MPIVPVSRVPKVGIGFTAALLGLLLACGVRAELAAAITAMVVPVASLFANALPADGVGGKLAHALAWNAESVSQPVEVLSGRIRALEDEVVRQRQVNEELATERDSLKAMLHGKSASTPIGRTRPRG